MVICSKCWKWHSTAVDADHYCQNFLFHFFDCVKIVFVSCFFQKPSQEIMAQNFVTRTMHIQTVAEKQCAGVRMLTGHTQHCICSVAESHPLEKMVSKTDDTFLGERE
jgi:hypothetical protein